MKNRNEKTPKSLIVILTIASLLFVQLPVFAHSGGTDENGGHYDASTGKYHYHHGWPAHDHDGGQCPYDFEDNVDHDRDESSGSSSSTTTTTHTNSRESQNSNHNKSSRLTWWQILLAIVLNAIWIVPFFITVILPSLTKENLLGVVRFILILIVACSLPVFMFSLAIWWTDGWSRALGFTMAISVAIMILAVFIIRRKQNHSPP